MSEKNDPHDHLPPPLGIYHEQPVPTTEALKQVFEQDPDYARWVLFRAEELMTRLDNMHRSEADPRETDPKEDIVALLLESRELLEAIRINRELSALFRASTTETL